MSVDPSWLLKWTIRPPRVCRAQQGLRNLEGGDTQLAPDGLEQVQMNIIPGYGGKTLIVQPICKEKILRDSREVWGRQRLRSMQAAPTMQIIGEASTSRVGIVRNIATGSRIWAKRFGITVGGVANLGIR